MTDTASPTQLPEESVVDSGRGDAHRTKRHFPDTESRVSMPFQHSSSPSSRHIEYAPRPRPPSPSPISTRHNPRRRAISAPQPFIWTTPNPRPITITPTLSRAVPPCPRFPTQLEYGLSSASSHGITDLPLLRPPSPPVNAQRKPRPRISLIIPRDWQGYAYSQE
jgi:hypothetical protein